MPGLENTRLFIWTAVTVSYVQMKGQTTSDSQGMNSKVALRIPYQLPTFILLSKGHMKVGSLLCGSII